MKIAVVGPLYPFRGGIAHFTTLLALRLGERHEVLPITYTRQYPAWLYPGSSDRDTTPGRLKVRSQALLEPFNPLAWQRTAQYLVRTKPDLVVLQWWVTLWAPAMAYLTRRLRQAGIPFTFIIHNALPHEARWFDPFLARLGLAAGRRFLVMNDREGEILRRLVRAGSEILECPLPVFSVFPDPGMTRQAARKALGLPAAHKLVLFFGIVRPYKGLAAMLEALPAIRSQRRDEVDLVIAGEFWEERAKYLDRIAALGLRGSVHLFDRFVSDRDAARLFSACDLFVAPYLAGTQSASIKAALSFGVPMVVTPVVADPIMQAHPEICRVAGSTDPHELSEAVLEMLDQPRLDARAIGRISRESWDAMVAHLTGTGGRP